MYIGLAITAAMAVRKSLLRDFRIAESTITVRRGSVDFVAPAKYVGALLLQRSADRRYGR
jgi:hypothetical protein